MKPTLFKFQEHAVRVVQIKGQPWFVAADICRCLGLVSQGGFINVTSACRKLNSEERGFHQIQTPSPNGTRYLVVSESGLYKLIMRSDKTQARKFQDWVTQEVLPSLRKNGAYVVGQEKVATGEMTEAELMAKAVLASQRILGDMQERLRLSEAKTESTVIELVETKTALVEAKTRLDNLTLRQYVAELRVAWTKADRRWFGQRAAAWAKKRGIPIKRLPTEWRDSTGELRFGEAIEYPRALLDEVRLSFGGRL